MKEAVRAWLNATNRSYEAGVKLYAVHGKDSALLARLQSGQSARAAADLFQVLKGLLVISATIERPAAAPAAAVKNTPDNLIAQAAKRDADRLYKEMSNARAQLLALCDVKEMAWENEAATVRSRAELATRVIKLNKEVDAAYAAYRFALEHGRMPDVPEQAPRVVDPLLLHQNITNLRKSLSKWRKRQETAETLQVIEDKEALLTQLLKEYDEAIGRS